MNKIILISLFVLISPRIFSQTDALEKIEKLNQKSFSFQNLNYAESTVVFDDNSRKLIQKGKINSRLLIDNIDSDGKFIAIHLILTKIWSPKELNNIRIQYISDIEDLDDSEIIKEIFTINKLIFINDIEKDEYLISNSSIKKIKSYWYNQMTNSKD